MNTSASYRSTVIFMLLLLLQCSFAGAQAVEWKKTYNAAPSWNAVAYDAAATASGAFVIGRFYRSVNFGGGYVLTANNYNGATNSDGFFLKLDQQGNTQWAYKIATDDNSGYGMHIDVRNNNIYIASQEADANFDYYMLLEKFDLNGARQWQKTIQSISYSVWVRDMYVDSSENIFVLYDPPSIRKYDAAGSVLFTLPVTGIQEAEDLVVDRDGNIYIVGRSNPASYNGRVEIRKFSPSGTLLWSGTYGAFSKEAYGFKIAIDDSANLFIAGWFNGSFSLDTFSLSLAQPSGTNGFVARLDSSRNFIWAQVINNPYFVHTSSGTGYQAMDIDVSNDGQKIFTSYGDKFYVYDKFTGVLQKTTAIGTERYFGFDEAPDGSIYLAGDLNYETAYATKLGCAPPVVSIAPAVASICDGDDITLTASGGIAYTWSDSLGNNATLTATPTVATVYSVTVTDANGCTASGSRTVTVNPISSTVLNETICFGSSFFFGGINIVSAGLYYDIIPNAWGCDSMIELNLSVIRADSLLTVGLCSGGSYFFNGENLTTTGTYYDTLVAASGCDSIVTLQLTVANYIGTVLNEAICAGESFSFAGNDYDTTGTYYDTLTASAGCDSIITLQLVVHQLPQPVITQVDILLSADDFETYQWLLEGNPIIGAAGPAFFAEQNGNYSVVVSDLNGCSDTSEAVNVTGVFIREPQPGIKLYPIPAKDILIIESGLTGELSAHDILGKALLRTLIQPGTQAIDVSGFAPGAYFIRLSSKENSGKCYKVIVTH